jgi:hypothetical protein
MRAIEIIDAELRLVAALRFAARERGRPLPSIDVADALLDELRELTLRATTRRGNFHKSRPGWVLRYSLSQEFWTTLEWRQQGGH